MSNLFISHPHKLGKDEALRRIEEHIREMVRIHANKISTLKEQWRDGVNAFQITVCGFVVSGTLTVQPQLVTLAVNIPFPASLIKGKIESVIKGQMAILLT